MPGRRCLYAQQTLTPATLVNEKQLTVWFSVPSVAMFAWKLGLLQPGAFPTLRWSLFCGEALSSNLASKWQRAAKNSILENLYGPTEATIAITRYRWDSTTSQTNVGEDWCLSAGRLTSSKYAL